MTHRNFTLFLPLPALITSLFIFQLAEAGRGIYLQQCIVSTIAFLGCFWITRHHNTHTSNVNSANSEKRTLTYLFIALALLCLPLLLALIKHDPSLPQRWLKLGGVRIYLAACLLPACLFLLNEIARTASQRIMLISVSALLLLTLALHTDAAQATAFAVALLLIMSRSGCSLVQLGFLTITSIASLTLAWTNEPAISPINYVEGVIQLASSHHPIAGIWTSIVTLALPAGLAWLAWKRQQPGIAAAALYYLVISGFAYTQLTPMPLLGFGASPIIGYFLLVGLVRRT